MKDKNDEQDDKVLVHGQCQTDENGVENNTEFQDRDADDLSSGRIGSGGRGGDGDLLLIPFFMVNVMMTDSSVCLCEGSG